MTFQRPTWSDALKYAFSALSNLEPAPLSPILDTMAGAPVPDDELIEFVRSADENDSTRTQIRMALAKWDADEAPGRDTVARSDARRAEIYAALGLSDSVAAAFAEHFPVFEAPAIVISKAFQPWYADARKRRTNVYWDDYESYLRDVKKWSAPSIASLEQTTTEIVERLSDPVRTDIKQTKGLVVGYVQSGKTANFTGVVAKAVDAGYRLIIVLTGTIEILRAQTQRRMDMELIGRENILRGLDPSDPKVARELDYQHDEDWHADKFVRHGAMLDQPHVVHIDRVTTHRSDYKRLPQGLTKLRFFRTDKQRLLNDPINLFNANAYVAVIKKHKAPLEKLLADLKPHKGDLAQLPVLIIDDESDQASVDTTNPAKWNKDSTTIRERTKINELITEILKVCPRAQYVGYTATPFANVLVDPDDGRDLFPADFALSLRPPPGYMGVKEFHDVGKRWDDEDKTFRTSNEKAHVRALIGDVSSNPDARVKELQEALDAWVLSGAIKKFRESKGAKSYRHHTMLIHESAKQAEHDVAASDVRTLWHRSKFNSTEGHARLKSLYDDDYHPVMIARANGEDVPNSFDELKPFIGEALAQITIDGDPILIVNSDKEIKKQQKKLDFEADKVWRILVGGNQLSRGFTIEGLTISYFRRKAGQADTLMQAGRWFGFRPGYQDLVRLYIRRDETVDLYDAFEALLLDEEAFRTELKQYEGFDEDGMPCIEPRQIPPLVSQHLPGLRPTARNKMWNAVIAAKATAGGFQDRYSLPRRGDAANLANLHEVGVPLLSHVRRTVSLPFKLNDGPTGNETFMIGTVGSADFFRTLSKYSWHPEYDEVITPFKAFLERATADGRISEWVIAWHQPSKHANLVNLDGLGASPIVTRKRRAAPRTDFAGSDRKHTAALEPIAAGSDVPGLPGAEARGVVLVYLADDRPEDARMKTIGDVDADHVIPLLSFATPRSATPHRRDLIQWTVQVKEQESDAAVWRPPN
ncbi:Z1 domain-containing protein [Glycomyces harbinensis]|uniref:Z1 domain-containing protein n=1 Tax=Glycomyces harbinensis TaxID=58114 RepID=A0A1G7DV24_9ACTN|nr:Z1 domain-containing protein [Glycomyces harbinensis]SDE55364.1 Z1 domain-containing protein [Glycomyces harbinensis]